MSVPYAPPRWPAVASTTVLWALALASIVFWSLRLLAPPDAVAPPAVNPNASVAVDPAAVAQFLGAVTVRAAPAATPDAASRFVLQGVVADAEQQGAALIAVDGKPARPFRVGSNVAEGFVLQSVNTRAVALGASLQGATALTLNLPTRPLAPNSPPNLAPNPPP